MSKEYMDARPHVYDEIVFVTTITYSKFSNMEKARGVGL